jgi:hypothetical protein
MVSVNLITLPEHSFIQQLMQCFLFNCYKGPVIFNGEMTEIAEL